jgi:hypothetical protein
VAFLPGRVSDARSELRAELRESVVRMVGDGCSPKLIAEARDHAQSARQPTIRLTGTPFLT